MQSFSLYVWIALFGAAGALGRWWLGGWMHALTGLQFPIGTLTVNVLGCFLIGLLTHVTQTTDLLGPALRDGLRVGFLGALTTFSTFGYETLALMEENNWSAAGLNVLLNVAVGLATVWGGMVVGRFIFGGA